MKVLIVLNSAWNLFNFRSGLIKALVAQGHEVILAAPEDEFVPELKTLGAQFVNLPMKTHGTNPFADLKLLWCLIRLIKKVSPSVLLTFTTKPNIYGGMAGRIMSVPVINNIAGLGSVFIKGGWVVWVLTSLYRLALVRSSCVFFQNPDDRFQFIEHGLVPIHVAKLVPGSGIDLQKFQVSQLPCLQESRLPNNKKRFVFLLVARLLKDKGILEYEAAARYLKPLYPQAEFALLGALDQKNSNAISSGILENWQLTGILSYWGSSFDVRNEVGLADCVILPSYREGTPRSLLEGAAMGRPLIASDVPGCREVVQPGLNGFLCRPRDVKSLALQMETILNLQPEQLQRMAQASRALVEDRFDERLVIKAYATVLDELNMK